LYNQAVERSKADSFTAFLKEKQRLKSMRQPRQQGATPLNLLNVLAAAPRLQMLVQDLQAASGMSYTRSARSSRPKLMTSCSPGPMEPLTV